MKWFCTKNTTNDLTRLCEKLALSDHLVNLYGPTLVHQDGKGGVLLKPVNSIDMLSDEESDPSVSANLSRATSARSSAQEHQQRLSTDEEPPPPLPPRPRTASMIGSLRSSLVKSSSFRKRGHSESSRRTLTVPGGTHLDEEGHMLKTTKEDLDLVRHVFKNSFNRVHIYI
jgi:hypothetical protein